MLYSSLPGLLRVFVRGTVYGLSGITLISIVLFFEKERFVAPVLKEYIPRIISSRGGPLLDLGKIGGNYLTEIDFQDISLRTPYPPLKSLSLSSVKLSYTLSDLLSGTEAFLTGIRINVSGGEIEIDLEPKEGNRVSAGGKSDSGTGPGLPYIKADDLSLKLNRKEEVIEIRHGALEISGFSENQKKIKISVPEAVVKSPLLKQNPFSFNTDFLLSTSGALIEQATFNGSSLTRSARVDFGDKGISRIKARLRIFGGTCTLDHRIEGGIFRSNARFKSINIGKAGRYLSHSGLPDEGFLDVALDITGSMSEISGITGNMRAHLTNIKRGENKIDEADATVSATKETFFIKNARFRFGENRVDVKELRLPRKSLIDGKIFEESDAISGHLNVLLRNVPGFLSMLKIRALPSALKLPAHEFSASAEISDGIFHINGGHLKSGGSVVDIKSADIPLFASPTDPARVPIAGEGSIRVKKLADITDILSLPRLNGSLSGDVSVSGTLADPEGSFSLNAENVSRDGLLFDSLRIAGKVEKNIVSFSKIEAFSLKDIFKGSGSYDMREKRFEQTRFSVDIKDVSVYKKLLRAEWIPDSGILKGSARVSGSVENPLVVTSVFLGKWKYPKISLASGEVKASIDNGRAAIKHFAFSTSRGDLFGSCSVSMSGATKSGNINVPSLVYRRKGLNLTLLKPASISLDKGGDLELKNISFSGAPAKVEIDGRISREWELDLNMAVTKGNSDGVPEEWMPARVFFKDLEFKARLTGSFASPKLSVSGEVKKVGPTGGPLSLRGLFGFELSRAGVYLSQFNFSDKAGHRINLAGRIPFKTRFRGKKFREIKVDGDVSIDEISALSGLFVSSHTPSGALVARVSVRGTPDEPTGELHIHTKDLNLPLFKYFPFIKGVTGDIDIHMDQRRVNLDKVSLVSDELGFSASGSWEFGKTFEQILNGEELTLSDSLDTSGELEIKDIGLLTGKIRGLRRLEGGITVTGHLSGPITRPEYRITLLTKESELQANTALPSFAGINGKIVFENERVDPELGASLGGSPVSLVGTIFWDRKPFRFNMRFEGDNLLYYRKNGLKVRGNTTLHLSGDSSRPVLKGEVGLTESKFVKNIDFLKFLKFGKPKSGKKGFSLFSLKSPPFKNAELDIAITSQEPFLIKNSFVRGTLRPELRLRGTGGVPILEGNVYIDPTIFQLPYGKLKVTGGFLRFLEAAPDKPVLDLNAEGRLLNYDIFLHAEGPYNEPVVTLSSVPPLPEDELLLLVLAGELPKGSAVGQKNGIGLNVAVYLSRSLLFNWFKSDSLESDESILERFDVEIGRNVTEAGAETVEAQFFIDRNIIGRQEEWFLTSEKDRFDDFNSGLRVVFKFE